MVNQRSQDTAAMIAMDEEVRTAAGLLRLGLAAVQATGPSNDFYHLPMLLLSQGFERLGKLALNLRRRQLSKPRRIASYGHDLLGIVRDIINECYPDDYLARPVAKDDFQFLGLNGGCRPLLNVLHTFANGARYWDLDVAAGSDKSSCQMLWTELRDGTVAEDLNTLNLLMTAEGAEAGYRIMNQNIVVVAERFARAQARLFMLGPLGDNGRQLGTPLHLFYSMRDDQLGTRDYRLDPWTSAALL